VSEKYEPWAPTRFDASEYSTIDRVRWDRLTEQVTAFFADGARVDFDPLRHMPCEVEEIDLWVVASNEATIIDPHRRGWFDFPLDVIRRGTDPEVAALREQRCAEVEAQIKESAAAVREETPQFK
jgi:hypothetical protein